MQRSGALIYGLVLSQLAWAAAPLSSRAASPRDVSAIQRDIESKGVVADRKRRRERVLTSDITAYSQRIGVLQRRVDVQGERLAEQQRDLVIKERRLLRTQSSLRSERIRLTRLRARLAESRRILSRRLVELYAADRLDVVSVVLDSKGFANLLERTEFASRIIDSDRRIIGIVRDARRQAVTAASRLRVLVDRRTAIADTVRARRDQLAAARQALIDTRVGLQQTRGDKRRALASTRTSRRHLEVEIASLRDQQAKVQAALRRAQNANARVFAPSPGLPKATGSGAFIWPVTGPITSPFCERRSYEACHPGLDIAAPEGTPIRAPADGKVVLVQGVGASGGYGNYSCVQHSATLSSCYAHQLRFATSTGASVRQGQVIGFVGNTGRSFGAHLHFEVRVDGSVVNPLNYL